MQILNSSLKEKDHLNGGLVYFNSNNGGNNLKGDSNPPLGLSRSAFYPHELLRHSKYTKLILKKTAAANRCLAKVAAKCSADTFMVNQSLILRINICGENRHLRQAPKRYR